MQRRNFLGGLTAVCIATGNLCQAAQSTGERLANAARAQLGVTTGYDPTWTYITYPGGDVPRSTGVCADVVIRAARDALGFDLQKLVHEDMVKHFDAYPARRVWGSKVPDTNIDHRRVLNLEAYFQRWQSCLWKATAPQQAMLFQRASKSATSSPGCLTHAFRTSQLWSVCREPLSLKIHMRTTAMLT